MNPTLTKLDLVDHSLIPFNSKPKTQKLKLNPKKPTTTPQGRDPTLHQPNVADSQKQCYLDLVATQSSIFLCIDGVLFGFLFGLEEELEKRLEGKTFSSLLEKKNINEKATEAKTTSTALKRKRSSKPSLEFWLVFLDAEPFLQMHPTIV